MEHAKLSPSSMYRIMACPASVFESSFIPKQAPSQYAAHGTMLHDWVTIEWNTPGAARKSKLEREDQEYILTCIDYLTMVLASCGKDYVIKFETKVGLETYGVDDVWGTADVIIYDYANDIIHVIDWKFGHGVAVYVENNTQAMIYGAAAIGYPSAVNNVMLHIVQPPLNYQGEWAISAQELEAFVFGSVQSTVELVDSENPTYGPAEDVCRFCPAAMKCRSRFDQQAQNAATVFQAVRKLPHVTSEELSYAIQSAKEYQQYSKQLFGYAEECILKGEYVPGWKLVRGRSQRKWGDIKATIKWLDKNNEDVADHMWKKQELKSPSQMEKMDRKLKKDKGFMGLITKPPGKPTLVVESDKRPAIEPEMSLEKAFNNV